MLLLEDVALEHRHADVDVQRAERAHDDPAAAAAEAQRSGGAATGRRAELAVFEVAHLDRLIHPLRDDPAPEAGDPADLGPSRCVAGAHHVDDPEEARHLVGLCAEAQR